MAKKLKKRVAIVPGKHAIVGAKMIEWVMNPESRPKTVEELREQFGDAVELSDTLKAVQFIDTNMEIALFRLPPREMVEASFNRAKDPKFELTDYNLPAYYGLKAEDLPMSALELLQSRVGDYTTGECE
ncbi:MAG: hypothetical protein GKS00_16970 [Alphaproteobacteria bacterium]|nr:hypothetical protein [Alphaproteobacteria bacterium]